MRNLIFLIHGAFIHGDVGILSAPQNQPSATFSMGKDGLEFSCGFRELFRQYIHVFSVLTNDCRAGKGERIIIGIEDSFSYENISGILYGREHFCHGGVKHVLVVNRCATEIKRDKALRSMRNSPNLCARRNKSALTEGFIYCDSEGVYMSHWRQVKYNALEQVHHNECYG